MISDNGLNGHGGNGNGHEPPKPPDKSQTKRERLERIKAHQFKPGNNANPKGRPKTADCIPAWIAKYATMKEEKADKMTFAQRAAYAMYKAAIDGDTSAAKLIFNRIEPEIRINANMNLPAKEDILQRLDAFGASLAIRE